VEWLESKIKSLVPPHVELSTSQEGINSEPLLDCSTCQIQAPLVRSQPVSRDSKCCDFNPFVSGFAVGSWLLAGGSAQQFLSWVQEKGVWTCLGVAQPAQKDSQKRPRCQFYLSDKEGRCAIWSQRPSVCRSYFCAHSSSAIHRAREKRERLLSDLEARLLHRWFQSHGGQTQDWQAWIAYMDTPYGGHLPQSLLFPEPNQAVTHYLEMWQWLNNQKIGGWVYSEKVMRSKG